MHSPHGLERDVQYSGRDSRPLIIMFNDGLEKLGNITQTFYKLLMGTVVCLGTRQYSQSWFLELDVRTCTQELLLALQTPLCLEISK